MPPVVQTCSVRSTEYSTNAFDSYYGECQHCCLCIKLCTVHRAPLPTAEQGSLHVPSSLSRILMPECLIKPHDFAAPRTRAPAQIDVEMQAQAAAGIHSPCVRCQHSQDVWASAALATTAQPQSICIAACLSGTSMSLATSRAIFQTRQSGRLVSSQMRSDVPGAPPRGLNYPSDL